MRGAWWCAPSGRLGGAPLARGGGWCSPLRAGEISAMKMAGSLHPPFSPFLPEENEKTGRARSKRVKEVGTRRTGARLNDRRSRNDFSARNWFERGFVRHRIDQLLFSLALPWQGNRLDGSPLSLASGQTAPPKGEPSRGRWSLLATSKEGSPFARQTHLPLPLGEVARRSRDGEGFSPEPLSYR